MNEKFRDGLSSILHVAPDAVRPELHFAEDKWDSMTMISVIALIDDTFGITIPVEKMASCRSVADLLAAIDFALSQKSAPGR